MVSKHTDGHDIRPENKALLRGNLSADSGAGPGLGFNDRALAKNT